jgi:hypothetical protein
VAVAVAVPEAGAADAVGVLGAAEVPVAPVALEAAVVAEAAAEAVTVVAAVATAVAVPAGIAKAAISLRTSSPSIASPKS